MTVANLDELETELRRIVDRLTSMPLARATSVAESCRELGEFLVAQTRLLTDEIPETARVPSLRPQGLGAMIAVLGRDYLAAARAAVDAGPDADGDVDVTVVLQRLTNMRRSLP